MLAILACLAVGAQKSVPFLFQNSQISVRFVKDYHYSRGELKFGTDLTPFELIYGFDKTVATGPDPTDPAVKSYRLLGFGSHKWFHSATCSQMPIEVVSDGKTIISYQSRGFRGFSALDASTGTCHWSRKPKDNDSDMVATLSDGVLYRFEDGHFYANKARTGEVIWDHPIAARTTNQKFSPIVVCPGRLYVNLEMEEGTRLFCLDTENGNERWSIDSGVPLWVNDEHYMPGFSVSRDKIVLYEFSHEEIDGLQPQSLACINLNNGHEIWKHPIPYTAYPFAPQASDLCALTQTNNIATLYGLANGKEVTSFVAPAAQVKGKYVVNLEPDDSLSVHSASTGDLVGVVKISPHDAWNMSTEGDHLLISRLLTRSFTPNPGLRVYEITETGKS